MEKEKNKNTIKASKKILLVDDDTLVRRMYEEHLKRAGIKVISVSNGMEALEQLEEEKVDLILSDLTMPQVDGAELVKRLKENPKTKNIPVIILSNVSDLPKEIEAIKKMGVKEYIVKSETAPSELVKRISAYFK